MSGVLRRGDSIVDAPGNLVDVVSNLVNLRPKLTEFLRGQFPDFLSLQKPDNERPFRQAALFRFRAQRRVQLRRQFDVHMMDVICFFHSFSFLRPVAAQTSARRRHRGQGLSPLQVAKMYIFAMLANSFSQVFLLFQEPSGHVAGRFLSVGAVMTTLSKAVYSL